MADVINHDQNLKKLEDDIESVLKSQGISIDGKTHLNIQRMTILVGNYCLDNTQDIYIPEEAPCNIEQVKLNEDQSHAEIIFKASSAICKKDGKLVENFLEDEIKKLVASKIEKDCPVDMLHLTDRAKYCLKASGITTLKGLLKTPLYDMKNLKNIGKKGYPSIRGELNRICYDIQFNKEQDRINKFIEIEEEMDEIEK